MKRGPRLHRVRYDKDGVPIDGCDWDAEDYQILWEAMQAARAKIAERHKERMEAACREATNGGKGTTPWSAI